MIRKIGVASTILFLIGFLIVLGAAGSLEIDTVTVKDFFNKSGIGILLMVIGAIGSNLGGLKNGKVER